MSEGFKVSGAISNDELVQLLKEKYPDREIKVEVDDGELEKEIKDVYNDLEQKKEEVELLTLAAGRASLSIQSFTEQQKNLFDDFVLLRSKYDEQKKSLLNAFWIHAAMHHPDLRNIPACVDPQVDTTFEENDDKVGDYVLDELLGEGQFASVRSCWHVDAKEDEQEDWAMKIILKERITTFSSLKRVSNEVLILKQLDSKYVIKTQNVMHTESKLYIVTERGGADMFDFFDQHPEGVPEEWAREIITRVLMGVSYCHKMGICHRDLKPENILLTFDERNGKCVDLKLCDFGLSTQFQHKTLLTDFCGSPGFFAPEMILHGAYHGDKADLWSVGCIMLELIMGHEQFCDVWMTSYDYDVLQDKKHFSEEIGIAINQLPEVLDFPPAMKDFVIGLLKLRSSERRNVPAAKAHVWVNELCIEVEGSDKEDDIKNGKSILTLILERENSQSPGSQDSQSVSGRSSYSAHTDHTGMTGMSINTGSLIGQMGTGMAIKITSPIVSPSASPRNDFDCALTPVGSVEARDRGEGMLSSMGRQSPSNMRTGERTGVVDPKVLRSASSAVEDRARHMIEQHNSDPDAAKLNNKHHQLHLPPIDPPTPSVGAARKKILAHNTHQQSLLQVDEESITNSHFREDAANHNNVANNNNNNNNNNNMKCSSSSPLMLTKTNTGGSGSTDNSSAF